MLDYNERQYRLMLNRLVAFEQGKLPLDSLVIDLEGLLNALEGVEFSWKQEFLHEWGTLEEGRAYALFKSLSAFDEEASETLRAAVARLKLQVLEKIDDPADHAGKVDPE